MKIAYVSDWDNDGFHYNQRITMSRKECDAIGYKGFKSGKNYGNAYTSGYIASGIYGVPGYEKQVKRLITGNSVVIVTE